MNEQRMQERATVRWLIPIVLAAPAIGVMAYVAIEYGPRLMEAVQVAVKLVVSP